MEDIIDIIVTETTNTIEITSQPTDEIIDVNIIDNREDVTLNVTPTLVEININSLTGNFGILWGEIEGTLSNQTDLNTALGLKADLVDGKVPSSQLPSYVDDVVEVATYSALPATGEVGKIYVVLDTNLIYRWSGSAYIEIKDSSAVWGAITGTLSNQTDLQNALNAKDEVLTFSSPLSRSTNTVSIPAATTSVNGYLTSTDWNTFNGKQAALNGTGFVKASGTTISYDNSTYLTTSSAASTYLPLTGGNLTGTTRMDGSGGTAESISMIFNTGINRLLTPVLRLYGSTNVASNYVELYGTLATQNRTINFPDASGTVALTSDLSSYLPLSGGTLTGVLAISTSSGQPLTLNSTDPNLNQIIFNRSGTTLGKVYLYYDTVNSRPEMVIGTYATSGRVRIESGNNTTALTLDASQNAQFVGTISATGATFSGAVISNNGDSKFYSSGTSLFWGANGAVDYGVLNWNTGEAIIAATTGNQLTFRTGGVTSAQNRLVIASTGAATFSSSVTATQGIFNNTGQLLSLQRSGTERWKLENNSSSDLILSGLTSGGAYYIFQNSIETFSLNTSRAFFGVNVGIGATPNDWDATQTRALELGTTGNFLSGYVGSSVMYLGTNAYLSSTGWKYARTGSPSGQFDIGGGGFRFLTAASGTAGNAISYTPAFLVNSSGYVGIGVSTATERLHIAGASSNVFLNEATSGNYAINRLKNATYTVDVGVDASGLYLDGSTGATRFYSGASERMRITSGGSLQMNFNPGGGDIYFRDTTNGAVMFYIIPATYVGSAPFNTNRFLAANSSNISFETGGSPRLTITSGGFVGINTTPSYQFETVANTTNYAAMIRNTNSSTPNGLYVYFDNSSSSGTSQQFFRGESTAGHKAAIYTNGSFGSATGTYGSIVSDIRLKENVNEASSKLKDLMKLRVVNFNLIEDIDKKKQIGFIAQEFKEVFPSLVFERDTREYDENGNVIKGLKDALGLGVGMEFAILTKAIQELKAELDTLKNK